MSVATATRLTDPSARFLNVLYGMTNASRHGTATDHARFGHAAFRADLPDRETLYALVRSGLVRMRDSLTTADIDPDEASEDRIINSLLSLTPAGIGWVEDNPRNALLRRVDQRIGRITLRRALEVADGQVIRQVLSDEYVSLHTTADRMEVPARFIREALRHFPDDYILLPTPKIRRVLGARS